ncbi:hypothetical protein BTA51_03075 [Hahella sp. CCB-MM4]|nr:hypothetical protein BTA51_03075 [Hahella sp. CCB-MM4]
MNPTSTGHLLPTLSLAGAILMVGCSSGNSPLANDETNNGNENEPYSSVIIDASANDTYTYFNLDTGKVVALTDAQAETSNAWHIAFRRLSIKMNGGSSGPGHVEGALAVSQNDFYTAGGDPNANVFLNATPNSEEEHLLAGVNIGGLTFSSDAQSSAIAIPGTLSGMTLDMGWFTYNMTTHSISVNTRNAWLLRSNTGNSYARFYASALSYVPGGNLDVTFEFDVQSAAANSFTSSATFNATVPVSGGTACFDFDADATVDCETQDSWDLKIEIDGRNWTLWTNSGVSGSGNGGALGDPYAFTELFDDTKYNNATAPIASGGRDITAYYGTDTSAGVFENNTWYAYDLSGQHKIWPNYRVYVIDTDANDDAAAKYKLQITNYYSDTGVSGHPNIRFMAIEE